MAEIASSATRALTADWKSSSVANNALAEDVTRIGSAILVPKGVENTPYAPPGERFHQLFEKYLSGASGKAFADQIAVESEAELVTFAELNEIANQIGHFLLSQGATSGDAIAILLDRGAHAYACMLAVSKIGCSFVPLDGSFPALCSKFKVSG